MPPRKRKAAAATAAAAAGISATSIRLSAPAERLRAAQQLRDSLLAKVTKRKAALVAAEAEADEATARIASVMEPRWNKLHAFDDEIHQLLDTLTSDPARQPRERAALLRLYHSLQKNGVISRRAERDARRAAEPPGTEGEGRGKGGAGGKGGKGGGTATFPGWDLPEQEAASAQRPPESQHGGLRALFRRLVEAFHPDKVRDEKEKAERTEVMKDITEAYRRGDLARLLELERLGALRAFEDFLADDDTVDPEQLDRRLVALDQSCDELRQQLQEIDRAVRAVRRSPHGAIAREIKRAQSAGFELVDLDFVHDLDRAAIQLRRIRDAFAGYCEEKLSLLELLSSSALDGLRDDDELLDAVTELARQMLQKQRAQSAPHTGERDGQRDRERDREQARAREGQASRSVRDAREQQQQHQQQRRR